MRCRPSLGKAPRILSHPHPAWSYWPHTPLPKSLASCYARSSCSRCYSCPLPSPGTHPSSAIFEQPRALDLGVRSQAHLLYGNRTSRRLLPHPFCTNLSLRTDGYSSSFGRHFVPVSLNLSHTHALDTLGSRAHALRTQALLAHPRPFRLRARLGNASLQWQRKQHRSPQLGQYQYTFSCHLRSGSVVRMGRSAFCCSGVGDALEAGALPAAEESDIEHD